VGWRDVLAPGVLKDEIKLWPFDGDLSSLLQPGMTVVAETYPAQYYAGLFQKLVGSKNDQQVRVKVADKLLSWSMEKGVALTPHLKSEIECGFSEGGDDAFDAVIGLFGMIYAVQNYTLDSEPTDDIIRNIEGWILGQPLS